MMLLRYKRITVILALCLLYGLISLLSAYTMLNKETRKLHLEKKLLDSRLALAEAFFTDNYTNYYKPLDINKGKKLEIWDTSGVGLYLWKHILHGDLIDVDEDGWHKSDITVDGIHFSYRLGYGMLPSHNHRFPGTNVFLVLNGRSPKTIENSKSWLDYILNIEHITNVGLLLLGDESCDNEWLRKYLKYEKLRLIFLIYDSKMIDETRIFSWPLGVASYRNFPALSLDKVDMFTPRKFTCNFFGTVYDSSTRQELKKLLEEDALKNMNCNFKWRDRWEETEKIDSAVQYQKALLNSDLTLSPVGKNAECYRTYEAMECGSIPIIEDVPTPASCSRTSSETTASISPYAILKQHNAPVIFIKNWKNELPAILQKFKSLSYSTKMRKRMNFMEWYANFKKEMQDKFIRQVRSMFVWDTDEVKRYK